MGICQVKNQGLFASPKLLIAFLFSPQIFSESS